MKKDAEGGGEGLRVETPKGSLDKHALWEREGDAGGADLRDTRVGEFVSLAALGGGRVEEADPVEEEEGEEGVPGPP